MNEGMNLLVCWRVIKKKGFDFRALGHRDKVEDEKTEWWWRGAIGSGEKPITWSKKLEIGLSFSQETKTCECCLARHETNE